MIVSNLSNIFLTAIFAASTINIIVSRFISLSIYSLGNSMESSTMSVLSWYIFIDYAYGCVQIIHYNVTMWNGDIFLRESHRGPDLGITIVVFVMFFKSRLLLSFEGSLNILNRFRF